MPSLEDLQKENARLKKMQQQLQNAQMTNQRRRQLLKENKRLARNLKHGKAIAIGRAAKQISKDVGKSAGKTLLKAGKGAFKGLGAYANFLAEQERKQKSSNRKLRTAKKSIKRKKKSTRRRSKGRR